MGFAFNWMHCPYGYSHGDEYAQYMTGENVWILASFALSSADNGRKMWNKYREDDELEYEERLSYEGAHYTFGLCIYELFRNVAELHAHFATIASYDDEDDEDDDEIKLDESLNILDCVRFYVDANELELDKHFEKVMQFLLDIHEACQPYCENVFHAWTDIIEPLADVWLKYKMNIHHPEFGQLLRRISETTVDNFRGSYDRERWLQILEAVNEGDVDDKYTTVKDAPTELPLDLDDDDDD